MGVSPRDCAIATAAKNHKQPHRPQLDLFFTLIIRRAQGTPHPRSRSRHWGRTPLVPVLLSFSPPTSFLALVVTGLPPLFLWKCLILIVLLGLWLILLM